MARLEDITWAKEISPTNLETIRVFEHQAGITFPDDYKAFAQKYAGGAPRSFDSFKFVLEGHPFFAGVGVFLAYRTDGGSGGELDDYGLEEGETETIQWVYENVEGLPESFVPITSGGGSDVTGYYFKHQPPKIAFWKFGVDEPVVIADSFTDFLEMLYDDPE